MAISNPEPHRSLSEGLVSLTRSIGSSTARAFGYCALPLLWSMQHAAPIKAEGMETRELRIVAFGTSLTARGGWQLPLEAALRDCLQRPVIVETVARSGATSGWAVTMVGSVIEKKPDVILVEFYANDAALNRFMTVGQSRTNMDEILSKLKRSLPTARVIVMAMNPIWGIRGFIRPFLQSYIDAHRQLAATKGFDFFDNRPAWLRLSPAELAAAIPDGSHPLPSVAAATIVPGLTAEIAGTGCITNSDMPRGTHP